MHPTETLSDILAERGVDLDDYMVTNDNNIPSEPPIRLCELLGLIDSKSNIAERITFGVDVMSDKIICEAEVHPARRIPPIYKRSIWYSTTVVDETYGELGLAVEVQVEPDIKQIVRMRLKLAEAQKIIDALSDVLADHEKSRSQSSSESGSPNLEGSPTEGQKE